MTSLLLDTHAMLWFFWDDPQLGAHAKSLIEDANNRKFVSIASCWEVAIKVGLGKLNLGESSRSFLPVVGIDAVIDQYGVSRLW
jgi:PIN domain nuclease of toxin-antitoxin system